MRWTLVLIGMLAAAGAAHAQVTALDREMLLKFYHATNGPRWTTSIGWLGAPGTECTWHGVTCFNGTVTGLELPDNNLGERDATHPFAMFLPSEPVNLRGLTDLDLAGNRFEQLVPAAYGSMTKLIRLDLGRMQLSGPLPAWLGNVRSLQTLYLDRNNFSGALPESWAQLAQLRNLDVSDNALEGDLPASWNALTQLRSARFSRNRFTGGFPAWPALRSLRYIGLSSNQLTGPLPDWLGDFTQLLSLELGNNRFDGALPSSLAALTQLETLELFGNAFTGRLPADLATMRALRTVPINNNSFEGPFPAVCGATSLETLWLTSNRFSGEVPACIGGLTQLRRFGIGANAFRGEVPRSLLQLTNLQIEPADVLTESHLFFNAMWTNDAELLEFIRTRFPRGSTLPTFERTQTVPPGDLTVTQVGEDSVRLQWTPLGDIGDGGYRVIGTASDTLFCDGFDAPCIEAALLDPEFETTVAPRTSTALNVLGLPPGRRYRFVMFSVSEPFVGATPVFRQVNRLVSDPSRVVGITLP